MSNGRIQIKYKNFQKLNNAKKLWTLQMYIFITFYFLLISFRGHAPMNSEIYVS